MKEKRLRTEAVKWAKEDMKLIDEVDKTIEEKTLALLILDRWRERLKITEEDLKEKN